MRDATLAAVDSADHPPTATYLWCVTRSTMARWAQHQAALGGQHDVYLSLGDVGTPDEDVTHTLDLTEHLPMRRKAMREHASQLNPFDGMPADFQHEILGFDHLRLVRGEDVLPWEGR
jgi:N-acetyl-1-D-myo-inositol-2-amino-2-deoxy-alpha-D-glucopyranoside deacetylase